MGTSRKSLKQIIAELEGRNSLSKQDADALRTAPRWSFTGAEITGYLGGGIVAVGVTWIIIAIAQDLNRITVYSALYVAGALALAAAQWLRSRGIRANQIAEILFGLGIGSLAGAIGLTLNDLELRVSVAITIAAALALLVGLAVCRRTVFVGTLIVIVAGLALIGSISESFNLAESLMPLLLILSGALGILLGFQRVGIPLVARVAGSLGIMNGSTSFAALGDRSFRSIGSIAICATLFYIGARTVKLELILGGGVGITIAIGILAGRTFDSGAVQGAVVTAAGAAIAALSFLVVRRKDAKSV